MGEHTGDPFFASYGQVWPSSACQEKSAPVSFLPKRARGGGVGEGNPSPLMRRSFPALMLKAMPSKS